MANDAGAILQTVNLIGALLLAAREKYAQARTLAEQSGVNVADLDAADARYAHSLIDPLAEQG